MRTRSLLTAALALLSIADVPASAANTAPVANTAAYFNAQIQSSYSAMDAALGRKDVSGAYIYYAENYVLFLRNGRTKSLADEEQSAAVVMAEFQSVTSNTRVDAVHQQGNTASVIYTRTLLLNGMNPQTGRAVKFVTTEVDKEAWQFSGGCWGIVSGHNLMTKAMLNGKPFVDGKSSKGK